MLILGSAILANKMSVDPVLENNSWETIIAVIKSGAANIPLTWYSSVKELVGTDNHTYHMRLADKQAGRYKYTNSARTTNAVFVSDELIPTSYAINADMSNVGGLAEMPILSTLNSTILNIIPANVRNLLEPIDIVTNTGGGTYRGTVVASSKVIIPSYAEVFSTNDAGYADETKNGSIVFGMYDYFADNSALSLRIKIKQGDTSASNWWLRSPYYTGNNIWYFIATNGNSSGNSTSNAFGIPLCLAF